MEEDVVATGILVVLATPVKRAFGEEPRSSDATDVNPHYTSSASCAWFKGLTDRPSCGCRSPSSGARRRCQRGNRGFGALARLKPGATVASGRANWTPSRDSSNAPSDTTRIGGRRHPARRRAVRRVVRAADAHGRRRVRPAHRLRERRNLLIARSGRAGARSPCAPRSGPRGRLLRQLMTESCF